MVPVRKSIVIIAMLEMRKFRFVKGNLPDSKVTKRLGSSVCMRPKLMLLPTQPWLSMGICSFYLFNTYVVCLQCQRL